jgi:beta-lactamase class A
VAHKTGEITRIHHDAAIVTAANGTRYVLVVLVRGIDDPALAARLIADLAREAHADAVGASGNAR